MTIIKRSKDNYFQRCGEKEMCTVLVGIYNGAATIENIMDVP